MFERFTDKARHAVVLAQEEARQLNHNYIGTEHVLLGLIHEGEGVAGRALQSFGMSLEGIRREVEGIIGRGQGAPAGHIPFTPRAKKTLELSLREALQLRHKYIGTEHILLGLIREGDGVAAQIMRQHGDLLAIRTAVLNMAPMGTAEPERGRRWLRRVTAVFPKPGEPGEPTAQSELSATPAADATLTEAARLAGERPVGSHHLLLAALADADSAAAKALAALGVDLDQAKDALRGVEVAGTSDESPEDAGRRQMTVQVTDELLTVVAADPVLVKAGKDALAALGDKATPGGTIRGADPLVHATASLAAVWLAIRDALATITRQAASASSSAEAGSADDPGSPKKPGQPGQPGEPGPEAA